MDIVIDKLSEIEEAADAIMDEAGVRKKAFAVEMENGRLPLTLNWKRRQQKK